VSAVYAQGRLIPLGFKVPVQHMEDEINRAIECTLVEREAWERAEAVKREPERARLVRELVKRVTNDLQDDEDDLLSFPLTDKVGNDAN